MLLIITFRMSNYIIALKIMEKPLDFSYKNCTKYLEVHVNIMIEAPTGGVMTLFFYLKAY